MNNNYSIPIIFSITGHRDLIEQDIPQLKSSVKGVFQKYKSKYPNTKLILISALAEGADMLVADVALSLGLELHVLIPYQEEDYLKSFDNPENIKEYKKLKAEAKRFTINSCVKTYPKDTCYQQLGEKIADISNILIALWDGKDNGKSGGTSAIVKYQREGFKENRFDAMDGNAIIIITTPRVSNPDVKSDFTPQYEYLGKRIKDKTFDKMLKNIDNLNTKNNINKQIDNSYLKSIMVALEERASKNQTIFKRFSIVILLLTVGAIVSLEIMHIFHIDKFVLGYGIGLLLAFLTYFILMKNGKVQDDFVHSRGLAEAIRVQNGWNSANLEANVAKYYLKDEHHKFTWIKFILKNLFYIDKKPFTPNYHDGSSVDDWINSQIKYFSNALKDREKKLKILDFFKKLFFRLGFISLILMFAMSVGELFHLINHKALFDITIGNTSLGTILKKLNLLKVGEHEHYHLNWHLMVFISGLFLLIATFIEEKFIKIAGYEDDIYHFNTMLSDFKEAKIALTKESNDYKKIVYDLGIKALDENSKWVVLHDSMRAKPSLE